MLKPEFDSVEKVLKEDSKNEKFKRMHNDSVELMEEKKVDRTEPIREEKHTSIKPMGIKKENLEESLADKANSSDEFDKKQKPDNGQLQTQSIGDENDKLEEDDAFDEEYDEGFDEDIEIRNSDIDEENTAEHMDGKNVLC